MRHFNDAALLLSAVYRALPDAVADIRLFCLGDSPSGIELNVSCRVPRSKGQAFHIARRFPFASMGPWKFNIRDFALHTAEEIKEAFRHKAEGVLARERRERGGDGN